MNQDEQLEDLVLNSIADDYEDLKMIVKDVTRWSQEDDLATTPEEIWTALGRVIEKGLAKAYRLSPQKPPEEIAGAPRRDDVDDSTYFYITPEGKRRILESAG